jgi:hypothetical protein
VREGSENSLRLRDPLTTELIYDVQQTNLAITEVWALWYKTPGDLALLERLPHLQRLHILDCNAESLDAIKALTGLRLLTIESYSIFDVDLSSWPLIEELAITWHRKFTGLSAAQAGRKRGAANSEQHLRNHRWAREHQSDGRDREWFEREIVPRLQSYPLNAIARATGLSLAACSRIRGGSQVPHPRHWDSLLALVEAGN